MQIDVLINSESIDKVDYQPASASHAALPSFPATLPSSH